MLHLEIKNTFFAVHNFELNNCTGNHNNWIAAILVLTPLAVIGWASLQSFQKPPSLEQAGEWEGRERKTKFCLLSLHCGVEYWEFDSAHTERGGLSW